ncbi:sugar abc transporter permease : Inner-membrane translocator OS=Planctomyces limnophilus (strain ATCC 43296 / DSM 3776 / IFAM 1008 / 290) GN=Plim_0780 PE=4 SV=1: BPD_transp_2 [Gemmataceae bacterium]|nr:sugar abc transporter permease : Inner-membrane translocator OS=Planctomyces limnophilus (strain ATCC 43296 / DSM 3776 / IFAM 1008 / 290) GN=Plim_0780 PE=4 SV=1: BPD_transp_2 [Gemmataceae bacterium]VTT96743.1 sugar abc transporter permease : Inner-membrane translocator OS=Planctomyces limnophilus (strain ATCC 43296 / DSM 3776 / IFAM 1008 / 290) GN=Plim_0780 PE=4 SV=1: BPD_transp_2 [Gemmataceae bacterium]
MTRILGVLGLLVALYAALASSDPNAGRPDNLMSVANLQGRYGVITLGAALVIIVGGIDLSIGAVVGCSAVLFGVLMNEGVHPFAAVPAVALFGATVGLINGLLITRLKLQPFLVTLCGMFVYRGVARLLGGTIGQASVIERHPEFKDAIRTLRYLFIGKSPTDGDLLFPAQFVILLVLAAVVGFFIRRTAYGRYWYAIGHSELAAKYAGVNVNRQRVAIYTVCSALAAVTGVLLFLDAPSVQSDNAGNAYELYAILGAVLGGCSLRGGEGTAVGMVLGAMVLPVLENLVTFQGAKSDVIPLVIGATLLFGAIVDELIRGRSRVHR